jgi:uncharacterized protein
MPLTDPLGSTYRRMAGSQDGLLGSALRHGPDAAEALLAAGRAPAALPLASRIRVAAFRSREAALRLAGRALPDRLARTAAEGREARDRPGTVAEARARIAEALAGLDTLGPGALDGGAALAIALDLPDGPAFDLTGEADARDRALPQLSVHVVTAHAILRSRGIAVGKADRVPHMFADRRAGAARGWAASSGRGSRSETCPGPESGVQAAWAFASRRNRCSTNSV